MLSSDADVSRSLPGRHAFTVAKGPFANTPRAPSSSSAFSRVTAFPWEPDRASCGVKPRESFDYGPRTPFRRSIFQFRSLFVLQSNGSLPCTLGPVLEHLLAKDG
eukprot:6213005-Pleurochrysis_carterae.AAC.1